MAEKPLKVDIVNIKHLEKAKTDLGRIDLLKRQHKISERDAQREKNRIRNWLRSKGIN